MVKIGANLDLARVLLLSLTPHGTQPARDLRTQVGISSVMAIFKDVSETADERPCQID